MSNECRQRPSLTFLITHHSLLITALCDELLEQRDVHRAADDEGHALVDRLGLDIQDALRSGTGAAAGALDDEREGRALVQEAQLTVLMIGIGGIAIEASVQQSTMEVGHQRAAVAKLV